VWAVIGLQARRQLSEQSGAHEARFRPAAPVDRLNRF